MDSPAAVCGIMGKHYVTESYAFLAKPSLVLPMRIILGRRLFPVTKPEDLPISVDCFKFSRKDAKVLFIDFFLGGMLCQRVGTR